MHREVGKRERVGLFCREYFAELAIAAVGNAHSVYLEEEEKVELESIRKFVTGAPISSPTHSVVFLQLKTSRIDELASSSCSARGIICRR